MMNATSLYVSTCKVAIQADINNPASWSDLFRLVPYLRQSLCCTVCGNLLIEPQTPTETNCQHHVCRKCKGGRKKLKPTCSWCRDYDNYVENVQLRILLQCYKKLCEYIMSTDIFNSLSANANSKSGNSVCVGSSSLMEFIQEGAGFQDEFKSNGGLSKSAYSILPCVYTSTSTQTHTAVGLPVAIEQLPTGNDTSNPIRTVSNGSSLYSVMYAGNGTNKLTIKRKNSGQDADHAESTNSSAENSQPVSMLSTTSFKKPPSQKAGKNNGGNSVNKRKGCRCGNATAMPGKLTCCGQRCPCYVESKACIDCRCRGCRNPHRPGGHKVRPMIPELESFQLQLERDAGKASLEWLITTEQDSPHSMETIQTYTSQSSLPMPEEVVSNSIQVLGVYTTQLQHIPSALPAAILMGDSSDENSDVEVDI